MLHEWQERPLRNRTDTRLWECVCGATAFGNAMPRSRECPGQKQTASVLRCKHIGEKLSTVPCGCGAVNKMLDVYACAVFGQCTERSSGKPQRYNGAKIAVCLGCPQRS